MTQAIEVVKHGSSEPAQAPRPRTGFVYDPLYLLHDTGRMHPERPERLQIIMDALEDRGLLGQVHPIDATPADVQHIARVHNPDYIAHVERLCQSGGGVLDPDTVASKRSYEVALLAVGGLLNVVDAVLSGEVRNAFAVVRPPGHHALSDTGMGFCLFNNVAVAARYLQHVHGYKRIFIVDWDVHHGNGTQDSFYEDSEVFYASIHRYPYYPGTGAEDETGSGPGKGYTLNIPMPAGSTSSEYVAEFEQVLIPAAMAYQPDFVLISAGFDAHSSDPLGGMLVRSECFAQLTHMVCGIANECCSGRVASVLEGGYQFRGLTEAPAEHLQALLEQAKIES